MYNYIIHITGKVCSGKSFILDKYRMSVPIFDMADFYRRHNCLTPLEIEEALILYLEDEVNTFLDKNKGVVVFESSGIGYHLGKILAKNFCFEMMVEPPDEIQLLNRLSLRGYSSEKLQAMIDLNHRIEEKSIYKPKLPQPIISDILSKLLK